jgi:AmmeMemoRadiSam system protein A
MAGPTLVPPPLEPLELRPADGEWLVRLAADAVRARLTGERADGRVPRPAALRRLGSSFVTLECAGLLRGCIGTLEAVRPLYRDVARNATRAMTDPRMEPLGVEEWPALAVSVAVLGPSEPLPARRLADLLRQLRPHVDGLVLSAGRRQATFLPAVWEKLPDPADFVAALLVKGGWAPDRLPPGATMRRYTTAEFHAEAATA